MCHYHQTSPESPFTQKRLITRPTRNGRITLTNNTLKITEKGETVEQLELSEEDYGKRLLELFGIDEGDLNVDV